MALKFEYDNRKYDIFFNNLHVILIIGNSAVGKSLMCNDLRAVKSDNNEDKVVVLDINDIDIYKDFLRNKNNYKKYKYVVIDNADILVDDEVSNIIDTELETRWILIGRRIPKCIKSLASLGILKKKNGIICVEYSDVY